ncbi:MAG: fatty acid desaturase CarF family protein [Burkholderiales bacterium]
MTGTTGYAACQRRLETAAIGAFAVLAAAGFYRLAAHASPSGWVIAAAALAGWMAADLLSGLVHWAFDRFGSVRTPVLGPRFVRPFREHHVDASRIARHDFVETNGASCIAALPAVLAAALMPLSSPAWAFAQALALFTVLGVLGANQCHKWAHMEPARVPRLVRLAQRWRLILRPEEHRMHHRHPFDTHYCTASGWLNPALNGVLKPWR